MASIILSTGFWTTFNGIYLIMFVNLYDLLNNFKKISQQKNLARAPEVNIYSVIKIIYYIYICCCIYNQKIKLLQLNIHIYIFIRSIQM